LTEFPAQSRRGDGRPKRARKFFAIWRRLFHSFPMAHPLALFLYEKLLPGGQLLNRLQDLGYRVQAIADPATLVEHAEREKPLLVLVDLEPRKDAVCQAIANLRQHEATAHIPVIAFSSANNIGLQDAARAAGATLVVHDTGILVHLEQLLQQALQVD